jgi:hypothetical protein
LIVKTILGRHVCLIGILLVGAGCRSPYYADQGALFGGLTGAGVGALVGDAVGSTAAGAAIGAGVGTLTGAVVGDAMDDMEARTRAQIAGQLGRQVQPGAVTTSEVVAMTQAGVDENLIASHVRQAGMASPLTASDVIYLHQQGVPTKVIEAMQAPPPAPRVVAAPVGPPVIVEEHHYGPPPPCWPHYRYHYHAHRPRVRWGFSVAH